MPHCLVSPELPSGRAEAAEGSSKGLFLPLPSSPPAREPHCHHPGPPQHRGLTHAAAAAEALGLRLALPAAQPHLAVAPQVVAVVQALALGQRELVPPLHEVAQSCVHLAIVDAACGRRRGEESLGSEPDGGNLPCCAPAVTRPLLGGFQTHGSILPSPTPLGSTVAHFPPNNEAQEAEHVAHHAGRIRSAARPEARLLAPLLVVLFFFLCSTDCPGLPGCLQGARGRICIHGKAEKLEIERSTMDLKPGLGAGASEGPVHTGEEFWTPQWRLLTIRGHRLAGRRGRAVVPSEGRGRWAWALGLLGPLPVSRYWYLLTSSLRPQRLSEASVWMYWTCGILVKPRYICGQKGRREKRHPVIGAGGAGSPCSAMKWQVVDSPPRTPFTQRS